MHHGMALVGRVATDVVDMGAYSPSRPGAASRHRLLWGSAVSFVVWKPGLPCCWPCS